MYRCNYFICYFLHYGFLLIIQLLLKANDCINIKDFYLVPFFSFFSYFCSILPHNLEILLLSSRPAILKTLSISDLSFNQTPKIMIAQFGLTPDLQSFTLRVEQQVSTEQHYKFTKKRKKTIVLFRLISVTKMFIAFEFLDQSTTKEKTYHFNRSKTLYIPSKKRGGTSTRMHFVVAKYNYRSMDENERWLFHQLGHSLPRKGWETKRSRRGSFLSEGVPLYGAIILMSFFLFIQQQLKVGGPRQRGQGTGIDWDMKLGSKNGSDLHCRTKKTFDIDQIYMLLVLKNFKLSNFIINSLKSYFSPGISITFASLPALFLFLSSPLTK
uniref:Signal peptide protein n=1 Tax=Heterorhabditis bacteriophora TaxID=37862 RepID=A0A1I7WH92_HETBA